MLINRRTFIMDMAVVASAPAMANLLLHASPTPVPQDSLPSQPNGGNVVFKIRGWDRPCENDTEVYQVWININDSWRTAWR
jgi:hypothetical protein